MTCLSCALRLWLGFVCLKGTYISSQLLVNTVGLQTTHAFYDIVGYRICTHLSMSYIHFGNRRQGQVGVGDAAVAVPKLQNGQWLRLYVKVNCSGMPRTLIHMHRRNRPRWCGSKLVRYTFLKLWMGIAWIGGHACSRHSKTVLKQLAVDGSMLSEQGCKAGPKVLYCTNTRG